MKLKAMLFSQPVLLSFLFLIATFWGKSIPLDLSRGFYTFSIFLKDALMLFLPVAIMIYIATALKDFKKNTAFVILLIICFEAISNTTAVWFAYFAVKLHSFDFVLLPPSSTQDLATFFSISFLKPSFWSPDKGVIVGAILGVLLSYQSLSALRRALLKVLAVMNLFYLALFILLLFAPHSPTLIEEVSKLIANGLTTGNLGFIMIIFLVLLSYPSFPFLMRLLDKGLIGVNFVLKNIFSRVVPFFAFGFLLNLSHSGLLEDMTRYFYVFAILFLTLASYLSLLFIIGARFNMLLAWKHFINTLPSGIIAFTSMSSAATMPYTIQGAEKNLQSPALARMIIPATTNIQQVGDCLINAFMCLIILLSFGKPIPSFYEWGLFTGAFIVARYATTAVAGGAILVMLPIYMMYLEFTPQEISLIVALNLVLDPFVTASNVLGNGALAILLEKLILNLGFTPKNDPISSN